MTRAKHKDNLMPGPAHMSRLLTVRDVAERLQVSGRTIHRLISAGDLPVIRIGRAVRLSEAALQAYLTNGDRS